MIASRILSLGGVAAWLGASPTTAAPTFRRAAIYPATSTSTGFTLIANVTDRSHDLSPSVNNIAVTPLHVGAGLNLAVLDPSHSGSDAGYAAPIFYLNGTNPSDILADAGTEPVFPEGLTAATSTDPLSADVYLNLGGGSPMTLSAGPAPYVVNQPSDGSTHGTFAACDTFVAYYQSNHVTLRWIEAVPTADGAIYVTTMPAGCAPVRLLPQCAVLADLPAGSAASHDHVQTVGCYEDVAGIDWSRTTT